MKRLTVIALVFAAFAANAAYEYYWFGTAGDGLWTTPANWSSSPTEYVAVTVGYPRSSSFNVHIDTSVAADHHVTIHIPKLANDPPQCQALEIFDSTGDGTLTFVGEEDESGRPTFPLRYNNFPVWTATGHPMRVEFLNFSLNNGSLSTVENECPGCSVLVSNCVATTSDNSHYMKLPGQHGGTMTVIDSDITTQYLNSETAGIDVAGYVFAVTNSTITITRSSSIGGPGTVVDIVGSTFALGSYYSMNFGAGSIAATNDHPNMKITFKDSMFATNGQFAYFFSSGGTILFDNVVQSSDCSAIVIGGLATTEFRNTSLRLCGAKSGDTGISGDLILDNSEWLSTNSARSIILNGPLHIEFRGRAPRFGGTQFSGAYPVTFDFLVPKGGYAYPPVNRMDNPATGFYFPSSVVGGSINVLPASPAVRASGTLLQPLIYVKDVRGNQPVCALANLTLTTLPNEKSKFLVTTDYSWEYEDVNDKVESDWTEVAVGYNKNFVAGVAVKIVGLKPGLSIFVR
ncbi:MAG: hypothetical protein J6Q49_03960 [Kiritimatiellae bacterium]|nr:hypothetical protein [Kiritimatiellia bacterium]